METQLSNKIKSIFVKEFKNIPIRYNDKKHYKFLLEYTCSLISHENMHSIMFKKFIKNVDIKIGFTVKKKYRKDRFLEDLGSYSNGGFCNLVTPKEIRLLKYFPKIIFAYFVNLIYDIIDRIIDIRIGHIFIAIKLFLSNIKCHYKEIIK